MNKKKLMIGVATAQNTTNIIPAIQFDVNDIVLIQTSFAKTKKWSQGSVYVLNKYNIKSSFIDLDKSEDSDISKIITKLENKLQKFIDYEIYWNIGGGQKPHQMAIWQLFTNRNNNGFKDKACYANAHSEQNELWYYENQELKYKTKFIESILNVEDLLNIYGFNICTTKDVYPILDLDIEKTENYFDFSEFREIFFLLPTTSFLAKDETTLLTVAKFKELLNHTKKDVSLRFADFLIENINLLQNKNFIKQNISSTLSKIASITVQNKITPTSDNIKVHIKNEKFKRIYSSKFQSNDNNFDITKPNFYQLTEIEKSSLYFENVVAKLVYELVKETKINSVVEMCANLTIKGFDSINNRWDAEYDLLIATKSGKLIAIDAKTFDFEKKDIDARLHNLQQAGGNYIDFITILPLFESDIHSGFIPDKLLQLPERLSTFKRKYYSISEKDFYFQYQNKQIEVKSYKSLIENF